MNTNQNPGIPQLEFSIVIPNHNRVDALSLTLQSLNQQTYPFAKFEVIVVDQASIDGSRELVNNFPSAYSLRLLPQDGKFGISVARNGGIETAKGNLIILLDADILTDPGLVMAHDQLHRSFESPLIACGRLLPYPQSYTSFIEKVANPEGGLDRGDQPGDFPFYWAFGGHISFPKSLYDIVGPFSPELKGAEDTEFAYRAHLKGYAIKNCPQAIGYHNHSRGLAERKERSFQYWKMIPKLMDMHPELQGTIPGISDLEPLHLGKDTAKLTFRKLKASFWSIALIRRVLFSFLIFCENQKIFARFAKAGYFRLMLGEMKAGARSGQIPKNNK